MIIQLEGADGEDVKAGARDLLNLSNHWGVESTTAAPPGMRALGTWTTGPVAAILVLIPAAALSAYNPADRIRMRHRAQELIDEAEYLAASQMTAWLLSADRDDFFELRTLTPDQLLNLAD